MARLIWKARVLCSNTLMTPAAMASRGGGPTSKTHNQLQMVSRHKTAQTPPHVQQQTPTNNNSKVLQKSGRERSVASVVKA
jgi:hypothetical protein